MRRWISVLAVWCFVLLVCAPSDVTVCAAEDTPPTLSIVQRAARDGATRSLTFLSSGYRTLDATRFDADVRTVVHTLLGVNATVSSAPWTRYAALWNVYAVFSPSADAGASRPHGRHHQCNRIRRCDGPMVRNNLGCSFGTPDASVLGCSLGAVRSLATFAPAADLLVVLVNEPEEMTSTSGPGLAVFTNAPSFLPFFAVRELSTAAASLASEYDRGVNEFGPSIRIPNCAPSLDAAKERWGYWENNNNDNNNNNNSGGAGVATSRAARGPVRGCYFSNYFRPTQNDCVLHNASVNQLCAVCREEVNMALLRRAPPSFLAAARCPPEGHTVHVDVSSPLQLSVGPIGTQPEVRVVWRHEDGTLLSANETAVLEVTPAVLATWTFPTVVHATIEDSSPYVRKGNRDSAVFTANLTFPLVNRQDAPLCNATTCHSFSVCVSCSGPNCSMDVPPKPHTVDFSPGANMTSRKEHVVIVAALLCTTIGATGLITVLVVYGLLYLNRPHEVLATIFTDNVLLFVLSFISVLVLVISTLIVVFAVQYDDLDELIWRQPILICIIFGSIMYVSGLANLGAVLFRFSTIAVACGAVIGLIALCGVGMGVFLIMTGMYRGKDSFVDLVGRYWSHAVQSNALSICRVQWDLSCSGFYDSCVKVNSSYCPSDCQSNAFATPCVSPYMEKVESNYIRFGVGVLLTGFLLVVFALLDFAFFLRFRRLSAAGKRRRRRRMNPEAATLPFTYAEIGEVQRLFNKTADRYTKSLPGPKAVSFLRRVFGVKNDPAYEDSLRTGGPLTFMELMLTHFPHYRPTQIDPRQLTPDEAQQVGSFVEFQRCQVEKLEVFTNASGVLSPEALYRLFQTHAASSFVCDGAALLRRIAEAAARDTPDAPMFRGLSAAELEGLRHVWVDLHPRIVGYLGDAQLDLLFHWTHGHALRNGEAFAAWKRSLDVRRRGRIGWAEFCYPFAKRALLRNARVALGHAGVDVPPEILARSFVAQRFGDGVVEEVFLPYEYDIPIERVLAHLWQQWEAREGDKE